MNTARASGEVRGRILVIRGGALGDFILTLPVLAALRQEFPGNHVEVLGYPKPAGLALAAGYADAVRPLESRELAGFFARGGTLDPGWAAYFASFHVILSFLYDPDRTFRDNVASVSRAQYLGGVHRPTEGVARHATDQLLDVLQRLAIFDFDPVPRLPGLASAGSLGVGGEGVASRRVAFHVGSGSERKNWPESHWAALLQGWAAESDWRFLMVAGEAESERATRLQSRLPVSRTELALNQPLPELARQLADCSVFVGHDSGISHLAAAVGTRGLVLWGPTDEVVWRPRSERFLTLRHGSGIGQLPVAIVDARVRALLE